MKEFKTAKPIIESIQLSKDAIPAIQKRFTIDNLTLWAYMTGKISFITILDDDLGIEWDLRDGEWIVVDRGTSLVYDDDSYQRYYETEHPVRQLNEGKKRLKLRERRVMNLFGWKDKRSLEEENEILNRYSTSNPHREFAVEFQMYRPVMAMDRTRSYRATIHRLDGEYEPFGVCFTAHKNATKKTLVLKAHDLAMTKIEALKKERDLLVSYGRIQAPDAKEEIY